jgi:putative FmdB family regulatory protein
MPVYEYECGKCGVFERPQRISEPALTKCPTCRRKVRRLISSTSFQLKGSGWYVTDYARAGKNGAKDGESKSDGKGESSSESKSGDAKSESKSESKTESKSESKPAKAEPKPGGSTPATTAS